jgi:GDP-D-mannose dehydratase
MGMFQKIMKILITGITGQDGSLMAEYLLNIFYKKTMQRYY